MFLFSMKTYMFFFLIKTQNKVQNMEDNTEYKTFTKEQGKGDESA